jgi:glycosyltransferase involved in cell wall biosynthesis
MRILIAAHGFPPTHSAGAERRAERMAHWLVANHHEVEVFAIENLNEPGFRIESRMQDGAKIHRLYYDVHAGVEPFRNSYDYHPIGDALRQVLADGQFDLVHLISGFLMGGHVIHTAQQMGLPVVITLTEYWFMCTRLNLIDARGRLCSGPETDQKCMRCLMEEKRRYHWLVQKVPQMMDVLWPVAQYLPSSRAMTETIAHRQITLRHALDAADLVICPSRYLIKKFAEFGFDTERYQYIRQGLVGKVQSRTASRAGDVLRLGYIGQIKPHKGVDLLVDAVITLLNEGQKISLDLWGSETEAPDYVAQLKGQTANYSTIRWNGQYTGAKVWDVLASLDTLVVPSRWYENSPTVILEAFMMRLPVVVTDLGGMAELVEHENSGLVFELNNADSLRYQLGRLLYEPGLLDKLRSGIPTVKTLDQEMQEIIGHYEQLLEKK